MHYSNLVIIQPPKEITEGFIEHAVSARMEKGQDDWWDWWQIGGRWTGIFDNYDPSKDPKLMETCELCKGTGTRKDWPSSCSPEWIAECNGCNGCKGTGKMAVWPTSYPFRQGDVIPISQLTQESYSKIYRVVADEVWESEEFIPWALGEEAFKDKTMPPLEWLKERYQGMLVVIVDNHF